MLKIEIHESTPANMLRAIRAACNELLGDMPADLTTQAAQHNSRAEELRVASERELDKSASCLSRYGHGGPINVDKLYPVGEQEARKLVEEYRDAHPEVAAAFQEANDIKAAFADVQAAPETDSAGAEWNPELHASTKAKNQDGTWKKRRGAGKESLAEEKEAFVQAAAAGIESALGVAAPALPPLPPAPPAAPLVTMNDIYALIQNHKCVLNDVIAAAQAMGFADVGAFSRDATPEQRAQLLQELTA